MSEQKRRFLEGMAAPTFLGAESVFVGDIRGKGDFVVAGEVQGNGELQGRLHVAVTGIWHGHVQAHQAVVAGKIFGGITVQEKLEIGRTAVIRGSISARSIAIATGAIVEGDIESTSGSPVVRFDEKRDGA